MKLMTRGIRSTLLCGAMCIAATVALAQGGRATINGLVTDQSGAVVGGAKISITNTQTGRTAQVEASSEGSYSVPFLIVGSYEVTASHDGFTTERRTGLTLTADQVASVNFVLKPGAVSTTVQVTQSTVELDTTTGAVGQVIGSKSIEELPLNGRNPASLVNVAAGAVDGKASGYIGTPGSGSGSPEETGASVNGSRMGGVYYQLDGINNMNSYFMNASVFPDPDATQEFRVITNNFDAQYGYTAGAIVSIATRSGTNAWHGNLFEFLRNNALNSASYFTKVVDPLKRNQFGGSLGGPIKRDKLFIFGNYQKTIERISISSSGVQVPSNAMLAGDFSRIPVQLHDPFGNPYPNNYIDPSTFSPWSLKLMEGIPRTDDPDGNILLTGRLQKNDIYQYTVRTDYNVAAHHALSGRVFYYNYNRPAESGNGNYLLSDRSSQDHVLNVTGNYTWTISSNTVNDFRLGYNTNSSKTIQGITQPDGSPISPSILGANLPSISNTIGDFGVGSMGISQIPVIQPRHNWITNDTLSTTKGRHTIVAGMSSLSQFSHEQATWAADPLMYFTGQPTGNPYSDFLLGYVGSLEQGAGEYNEYHGINWAAFGQDSIRLKPNLTLNVGLRWEPQVAARAASDKMAFFYPGQQSTRFPNAPLGLVFPGDKGIPKGGWENRWWTFSPRLAVAWQPSGAGGISIRSAIGLMNIPYDFSFYNWQSHNSPFSPDYVMDSSALLPCVLNIMDPYACWAPTNYQPPFPPFAGPGFNPGPDATFTPGQTIRASFMPGYVPGKELTWNLSIERAFGRDYLVRLAYIGREDYHLPIPWQANPGIYADGGQRTRYPDFGTIVEYASIGTASYNGLQVSAEKRFAHGLQFSSNFSWSKQFDTSSMASQSNIGAVANPFDVGFNRSISNLDMPLIFNNTWVWQTPKISRFGAVPGAVLGDWQISGIWVMHSGVPFSVYGGQGNNNSLSQNGRDLAVIVPGEAMGVHQGSKQQWLNQYFNTAAFDTNPAGTFGDARVRNLLQGPGWNNADILMGKNFPFRDHYNMQFRWEMFNAFNRTQFSLPNATWGASTFGRITSVAAPPRVMQVALKLSF